MNKMQIIFAIFLTVFGVGLTHAAEIVVSNGERIQDAVKKAKDGDTILVEPGEYKETVYIDKPNITLRGLRDKDKYAVLNGEHKLNDGIIASGHFIVIDGFWVKGYKGNGIMTQGANNFQITNNVVDGAFYGIFPQYGKNGLVQGNTVFGTEDAGIYVGMSDNIDVLENIAYENVMGLEFENCRNALMADNEVYNNATGIALTIVPGLPVKDAYNIVIRDNVIRGNNHENFAPASSIAAGIPEGVGVLVVGPDNVTIESNVIEDNFNAGVFVIDLHTFGMANDPKVDPYSDGVRIMNNSWKGNGEQLSGLIGELVSPTGKSGFEVIAAGKGNDSCVMAQSDVDTLGTKRWGECSADMSVANYETAMLPDPAESVVYTAEQKGRLTYLAVCTGCHAYDSVLHGPSMQSIQALYQKNPKGMIQYIASPVKKRKGFPDMPPQDYLGDVTLNAIADYILNDLGK